MFNRPRHFDSLQDYRPFFRTAEHAATTSHQGAAAGCTCLRTNIVPRSCTPPTAGHAERSDQPAKLHSTPRTTSRGIAQPFRRSTISRSLRLSDVQPSVAARREARHRLQILPIANISQEYESPWNSPRSKNPRSTPFHEETNLISSPRITNDQRTAPGDKSHVGYSFSRYGRFSLLS